MACTNKDNINKGDLILTNDGYFGIVLVVGKTLRCLLGNGIITELNYKDVTTTTLPTSPSHQSFIELLPTRTTDPVSTRCQNTS